MKRHAYSFAVNLGLLFSSLIMVFSGLLIQVKYHMGNHGDIAINDHALGISYSGWSSIHKVSIIILSLFMVFHIVLHWKWYSMVIRKKLIAKNIQLITLTILFTLVAITGYIPWLIRIMDGDEVTRKTFIEIHDKLALILVIYLVLHIIKRFKWLITTFYKLMNSGHSTIES
ncbi:MAG TPA: DUF4405 domain-containing protein [Williamwhitmania sp.]|nr:DUF4405 domain-containing protein [Williamwhitmania sp.]